MKVALNALIATAQPTGTGQYAGSLIAALLRVRRNESFVIYCSDTAASWFKDLRTAKNDVIVALPGSSPTRRVFSEQTLLPYDLKRRRVDVLHSLAFTSPIFSSVPSVVTVHDLGFLRYPETIHPVRRLYYRLTFRRSLSMARQVITVSNCVKEEVLNAFPIASDAVVTVHEAPALEFRQDLQQRQAATRSRLGFQGPYLLAVGTLEPRKNLPVLIRAFELCHTAPDWPYRLLVVGKSRWLANGLFSQVQASGLQHLVIFPGYIEQSQMASVYAGATLFLFPSLYEGFGLPLLEAFASGVPVLASDIPIHREVCGDAAAYACAQDPTSWATKIAEILMDAGLRSELIRRGYRRVKEFSWEKAAEETLQVYRRVCQDETS